MKIYLVGGAVRDALLGIGKADRDYVVVGATVQEMLAQGYQQVGRDFPVFLHPQTREEHALARTERKTGPGHTGFDFVADPTVTLEEDLARRDLTINAMARAADGSLIDPFNGRSDLEQRILRHVSPAFSEDPLRVLRVARFAARFAHLGFTIADSTMALMTQMSASGELDHLVAERVWTELEKAMRERSPAVFVQVLRDCGALRVILPEVDALFGIPQPAQHHPEVDSGVHTLMCVEQAAAISDDPVVRFATLVHDVGKALTPKDNWPHHYGHEHLGVKTIMALCQRLRVPKKYTTIARLACEYHTHCHRVAELRPVTILRLLESLDAFRRPEQMELFLLVCEADARGRTGFEQRPYPQADILRKALRAAAAVDVAALLAKRRAALDKGAMSDSSTQAETGTRANEGEVVREMVRRHRTRAIALATGRVRSHGNKQDSADPKQE